MRFSPDDVVCRVALNLGRVRTPEEALRAWLPLVSEPPAGLDAVRGGRS